jgi:hypothetical protein
MGKLLDENSAWVKQNYPEFVRALDAAEAKDKAKTRATENEDSKDKRQPKSGGGGGGAGIPKVGPKRPMEMKKGGKVSSASSRADGIATKGKTRGKIC